MNFNLISPEGNGYEYTIRFKEPIDIAPESQITLNWAEITRSGKVVLKNDANISLTIKAEDVFPSKVPTGGGPFANNLPLNGVESATSIVKAGTYTFTEFATAVDDAMAAFITIVSPDEANNNMQYYQVTDSSSLVKPTDNNFRMGYELGQEYHAQNVGNSRQTFDPTGNPQANAVFTDGAALLKTGGAVNTFDSFATDFSKHYFHYQFMTHDNANFQDDNYVYLRAKKKVGSAGTNQQGKIIFGLYSKEVAQGVGATPDAGRTAAGLANNIDLDTNGFPKNFINIVSEKYSGDIIIQQATSAGGIRIEEWDSIGTHMGDMQEIYRIPIRDYFSDGVNPAYSFQTYIDSEADPAYKTRPKLYYRLLTNMSTGTPGDNSNMTVIFDSKDIGCFLPFDLLKHGAANGAGLNYDNNAVDVNSQIPFSVALYADTATEGWQVCRFKSFKKNINSTNFATFPQTIINKYKITLDSELQKAIGFVNVTLHPNAVLDMIVNDTLPVSVENIVVVTSDLDVNWRRDNYSIFIDLPISAFKNVASSQQGGFRKTILANLPSPFSTGVVVEPVTRDNQSVISTYQPYQPITNDLSNNKINVNSLRIKILDMKTETLSTELSGSILNFTIHKPK